MIPGDLFVLLQYFSSTFSSNPVFFHSEFGPPKVGKLASEAPERLPDVSDQTLSG